MQVDNTLILAAGFGTRMRSIGRSLPKPLLPIFDSTILEIQYEMARKFTKGKIFINAHYHKDKISTYCKQKNWDVEVLEEDPILDVGGAVHNVARHELIQYKGSLLILNADLILFLNENDIASALEELKSTVRSVLWTKSVNRSEGYNKLQFDELGNLEKIVPASNCHEEMYVTYTGVSLVNLNGLTPIKGVSSFFSSVVKPGVDYTKGLSADHVEYYDFGTVERYYDSIWAIFELIKTKANSELVKFLINQNFINFKKVSSGTNCYNCHRAEAVLNFSNDGQSYPQGAVVLKAGAIPKEDKLKCLINGDDIELVRLT